MNFVVGKRIWSTTKADGLKHYKITVESCEE